MLSFGRLLLPLALALFTPRRILAQTVSLAELAVHNQASDCWCAFYEDVYDVTSYAPQHPGKNSGGGPAAITALCGQDGTSPFDAVHGNDRHYLQFPGVVWKGELIEETTTQPPPLTSSTTQATQPGGSDNPTTTHSTAAAETTAQHPSVTSTTTQATQAGGSADPTTPTTSIMTITLGQLAEHDTPEDCWILFWDTVYDLTIYAPMHPVVGSAAIYPHCGTNGTSAFVLAHPKRSYLDIFTDEIVGAIEEEESDDDQTSPDDKPEQEYITMAMLANHSTVDDCWICFYNKVRRLRKNLTLFVRLLHANNADVCFVVACENRSMI